MQTSEQTVVELYKCYLCARQVFMSDIKDGIGCRHCGSRKVSKLSPSLFRIVEYFLRNPKQLIVLFRENVLGKCA